MKNRFENAATALSLLGLGSGFSIAGILIVLKQYDLEGSLTKGIPGFVLGIIFLIATFFYIKRYYFVPRPDNVSSRFSSVDPTLLTTHNRTPPNVVFM